VIVKKTEIIGMVIHSAAYCPSTTGALCCKNAMNRGHEIEKFSTHLMKIR